MRILLVGPRESGKLKIANYLEKTNAQPLKKVANIMYYRRTILVPDSYLESPWMHKHVIALQQTASCGIFLQPVTAKRTAIRQILRRFFEFLFMESSPITNFMKSLPCSKPKRNFWLVDLSRLIWYLTWKKKSYIK